MFASVVLGNLGEQLELPYGRVESADPDLDLEFDPDLSDTYGGSVEVGAPGGNPSSASSSEGSEVHTPV